MLQHSDDQASAVYYTAIMVVIGNAMRYVFGKDVNITQFANGYTVNVMNFMPTDRSIISI